MGRWQRVTRLSSRGNPFECWERAMPRIPDELLDCVIYLYRTEMDARTGERNGGSGFLVAEPSVHAGVPAELYAVTNSHVIREGDAPVVRLNTRDGRTDVIPLTADQWHHHQNGDDVAVCPIGLQPEHHRFMALKRTEWFFEQADLEGMDIGPGDDVFFIGRFINHEGQQKNLPTVRWGNISMLPYEPVEHPRGTLVDSFLIEARSLSGYSGSPVFVYIGGPRHFRWHESRGLQGHPGPDWGFSLLGIDWGHQADYAKVLEPDSDTPVPEKWRVRQNSGIMNVVPAWKLAELLQEPELVQMRQEQEQEWVREHGESTSVLDTASEGSEFQRFENLARKLVRVPKEEIDAEQAKEDERKKADRSGGSGSV